MFFGLVQGFSKKEKWAFCPVPNGNSLKTLERKLLIIKSFTKHKCPLVNMNINQEHSRTVIVCCYQPLDSTSPVYILTCGIRRTLKNNLFLRARITQLKTQKDRFFFFLQMKLLAHFQYISLESTEDLKFTKYKSINS